MVKVLGLVTTFSIILAAAVCLGFLVSYPMMLLWNGCLVPADSSLHVVTWLQMWGITVLFSLLFKSSITSNKKD